MRGFVGTVLSFGLLGASMIWAASEQTVTPITPPVEQRIELLDGSREQRIEVLGGPGEQGVEATSPPTGAGKVLGSIGKGVLVVVAMGVSIGFTLASLLWF